MNPADGGGNDFGDFGKEPSGLGLKKPMPSSDFGVAPSLNSKKSIPGGLGIKPSGFGGIGGSMLGGAGGGLHRNNLSEFGTQVGVCAVVVRVRGTDEEMDRK